MNVPDDDLVEQVNTQVKIKPTFYAFSMQLTNIFLNTELLLKNLPTVNAM